MSVLQNVIKKQSGSITSVNGMVEFITEALVQEPISGNISMESMFSDNMDSAEGLAIAGTVEQLRGIVVAMATESGLDDVTEAQVGAATAIGALSLQAKAFLGRSKLQSASNSDTVSVVESTAPDAFQGYTMDVEAYDESANVNVTQYSMIYNLAATRQNKFSELFFPTVVIGADEVGLSVSIRSITLFNDILRDVNGKASKFNKVPLIRAFANPDILRNDTTKIVPVHRGTANADYFVPATVVPTRTIVIGGENVDTAPLAFGKEIDLLGISQTDTLLAAGVMNSTDALDPTLSLKNIYVSFVNGTDTDVVAFDVSILPKSNFTFSTQGNSRETNLAFTTTSIVLDGTTTKNDGSALVALAALAASGLSVRLDISISGGGNLEFGNHTLFGNSISVHIIRNSTGEEVPMTDASVVDLVASINSATLEGFDIDAWRTNSNLRQTPQLIDTTLFTYLYNVPVRAPISVRTPVRNGNEGNDMHLKSLITATRIATSAAGVKALLDTASALSAYSAVADEMDELPELLGAARHLVKPIYFEDHLDMNAVVDSLSSGHRVADIGAALCNAIFDYAYRMYNLSEYSSASEAMTGNGDILPTIIVGTDSVIERYINDGLAGIVNTRGFNIRVASTLDKNMAGKIAISFAVHDGNENREPNALTFGNMAWAPEVTASLPVSRGGQTSRELTVQPRYLHIVNLPVLTIINITNIPDVATKKVAIHNRVVA